MVHKCWDFFFSAFQMHLAADAVVALQPLLTSQHWEHCATVRTMHQNYLHVQSSLRRSQIFSNCYLSRIFGTQSPCALATFRPVHWWQGCKKKEGFSRMLAALVICNSARNLFFFRVHLLEKNFQRKINNNINNQLPIKVGSVQPNVVHWEKIKVPKHDAA